MKAIFFILFFMGLWTSVLAQNNDPVPDEEQKLEDMTERQDAETDDDAYWQQLEEYKKHKLNLNTVDEHELENLQLLSALQIQNFLSYRNLFGKLLNIYELQAIPDWNIETIKLLLPYVFVGADVSVQASLKKRLSGGDHSFLFRASEQLEKAKGFEKPPTSTNYYLGSRQKVFLRYKYNYKNLLQYGLVADKDAGEQLFRGAQRYGFDFYSFHFFARNIGIIKSLAIGDFTVNMGQGLIQWQSLAFTKSSDAMAIKRQSALLRPYNSAGEFNFHRGAGITLEKGNFEATLFGSYKKISANLVTDTLDRESLISAFQVSGYHRTPSEIADRNSMGQTAFGGNLSFSKNSFRLSVNVIDYHFSKTIQKQDRPYNRYAITGNAWNNESIDYSYTYRNIHFFGEAAVDKNFHIATMNGALVSISRVADFSFVYRKIDKAYQSLYADAFTENTIVNNETGFYSGISIKPFSAWSLNAYYDLYQFPWLKYRVDAPSSGRDYLVQLEYAPNKIWSLQCAIRTSAKNKIFRGLLRKRISLYLYRNRAGVLK